MQSKGTAVTTRSTGLRPNVCVPEGWGQSEVQQDPLSLLQCMNVGNPPADLTFPPKTPVAN